MNRKVLALLLLTCFIFPIMHENFSQAQSASTAIGVKPGDWMEFTASTTGNLPAGHDVIWFKMEVINITGSIIWINIVAEAHNGTLSSSIRPVDFTSGNTQAWILIPANLGPGDSFFDSSTNSTVIIQGQKTATIDGVTRTITYVNTTVRHKEWDKATGFFIQTIDNYPGYNTSAVTYATNMWIPQILGLNPAVFYAVLSDVVVIAVAVALVIVVFRRKK